MKRYLHEVSLLVHFISIIVLFGVVSASAGSKQEQVHQMAHHVMPFEISKTVHIFTMTEFGGIQRVISKDPGAKDQVELIQQHLRHEARRFRLGDYSDPTKLHGADMPGLKELRAGASKIEVSFANLPAGAEITFKTGDLHMLTAIHRWFGAQLSEHGADARAE